MAAMTITQLPNEDSGIQNFLYHEASLLDDGDFKGWLALLDNAARYQVFVTEISLEEKVGEVVSSHLIVDEDLELLRIRVSRLVDGLAWSESPRSLTTRLVGNIRVFKEEKSPIWRVRSNVILWWYSPSHSVARVMGYKRADELDVGGGQVSIVSRQVHLSTDQIVGGSLSLLL